MKSISNNWGFSLARDLLSEGKTVTMRVQGQSMLPFFRSGQQVVLRPITPQDIRLGQVVMGKTQQGHFVIHRIIKITPHHVIVLGDGNYTSECIARDQLYGTIDCGRCHRFMARLWLWIRPLRKYPLWFLRRITPK